MDVPQVVVDTKSTQDIWPAIRKKILTFVMVPNFVMVVKFPNSSEIRNGSESPGMVLIRNDSETRKGFQNVRLSLDCVTSHHSYFFHVTQFWTNERTLFCVLCVMRSLTRRPRLSR